jgi:hypothetical protein
MHFILLFIIIILIIYFKTNKLDRFTNNTFKPFNINKINIPSDYYYTNIINPYPIYFKQGEIDVNKLSEQKKYDKYLIKLNNNYLS